MCAARSARRRFAGAAVPNFFRKPYGPGWALVGDAGYNKDPITAQGINDAFRDAELCASRSTKLHGAAFVRRGDGRVPAHARRARAADVRIHCQLATLEPPPPEMQQLFGAIHGNQKAMDGFVKHERRDDLAGGVLLAGEHRRDHDGRG